SPEHPFKEMNNFVEETTNGKIKDSLQAEGISDGVKAILINAVYFAGKWRNSFPYIRKRIFNGYNGETEMEFMSQYRQYFRVNLNNDIGSLLIMPYQDEKYNFFYLMSNEYDIERMRMELNGEILNSLIKKSKEQLVHITVPKFKIASKLDGIEVLQKMGIN
ncbi:hypothetical protein PMAYCL1PPCAC_19217, partial [Pristionchus mayeri]